MGSLITILVIILIIIKVTKDSKNKGDYHQPNREVPATTIPVQQGTDWAKSYQKTHLLTKNEYYEYKKLKQFADQNNLIICPKVRLLDIIIPREGPNKLAALGKINSKHVDFLICDENLYIKGIVELDDNSHKKADRIERDKFVDSVLTSVGYKVIHTYSVTEDTLKEFVDKKDEI